jgi:hypothetical protein
VLILRFLNTERKTLSPRTWYTDAIPRVGDRLNMPARDVKRVGGDANFYTETDDAVEGVVHEVVWTGDGAADIRYA